MSNLLAVASAAGSVAVQDVSDVADAVQTYADVSAIITLMKKGVSGVFEIAGSAFGFLMSNPLCAFMVCVGFSYVALGLVRRSIRVAKRA